MQKKETHRHIKKYMNEFMQSHEFTGEKILHGDVLFTKEYEQATCWVAVSLSSYGYFHQASISTQMRFHELEKIMFEINKKVNLSPPIDNETHSFAYTSKLKNEVNSSMPDMYHEEDVASAMSILKNYLEEEGFKMLEKYSNIDNIDTEINGDNFWETDWQKPFNLGGNLYLKRILVSYFSTKRTYKSVAQKEIGILKQKIKNAPFPEKYEKKFIPAVEYLTKYLDNLE